MANVPDTRGIILSFDDITVHRLTDDDLTEELERRWNEIASAFGLANVAHTPAWHRHYHARSKTSAAFGVKRAGAWIGFFNLKIGGDAILFTIAEKPIWSVPVSLAEIAYPGVPVPGDDDLLEHVLAGAMEQLRDVDGLRIDAMRLDSPFYRRLKAGERDARGPFAGYIHHVMPEQTRYLIEHEGDKPFLERFSGKTRNTLKRKRKKLAERAGGEVRTTMFTRPGQMDDFFRDALVVYRSTWQHRVLGTTIAAEEERRERGLAAEGLFLGFILYAGDRPIAMCSGNAWNGTFYYNTVGYDPAYQDFSPGLLLLADLTTRLFDEGDAVRRVDLGFGHADYKKMFGTSNYPEAYYVLYHNTPRIRRALRLRRVYTWLYDLALRPIERFNLKARIKKLLR
ncbi:GNAT family N-acetyltransferase [bacterium]|nr:GNAT family N-acetyltransferase [bacterium]